jgi:hypothetical protein
MIRTLRAFFLSRLLREKLLVVAFLGIGVMMWASALSSRTARFWNAQRRTTKELSKQDELLAQRGAVEEAAKKAAAQLDPAKTLDQTRLFATVQEMARQAGLKSVNSQGNATVVSIDQFSFNTQRFQILNADWNAFRSFYQAIQSRAPYLGISEIAMAPMRGNPSQVMATIAISSVEVQR